MFCCGFRSYVSEGFKGFRVWILKFRGETKKSIDVTRESGNRNWEYHCGKSVKRMIEKTEEAVSRRDGNR